MMSTTSLLNLYCKSWDRFVMSGCMSCQELAEERIDFCNILLLGVNLWFQKQELLVPVKSKIHRNSTVQFHFLFQAKHRQL